MSDRSCVPIKLYLHSRLRAGFDPTQRPSFLLLCGILPCCRSIFLCMWRKRPQVETHRILYLSHRCYEVWCHQPHLTDEETESGKLRGHSQGHIAIHRKSWALNPWPVDSDSGHVSAGSGIPVRSRGGPVGASPRFQNGLQEEVAGAAARSGHLALQPCHGALSAGRIP